MIEVTKDEFYKKINTVEDVYLSVAGPYPYTTLFKSKTGHRPIGYIQDHGPLEDSEYFLQEAE